MKKPIKLCDYKAVIFDMDGVITDTMSFHYDAWSAAFKKLGIHLSCYDVYCREGQDGFTSLKMLYRQYKRKWDVAEARSLLNFKEALFKKIVKLRFVRGSRPFIRCLHKKGFKLALVTGTSRHEVKRIMPKELFRLFDVSITGDEVKNSKPHPEPFLKALSALKLQAEEALVLENAPFGIRSAKSAGLTCIALETSLGRKYLSAAGADYIFKSFKELERAL